jgi:hypothetical protein
MVVPLVHVYVPLVRTKWYHGTRVLEYVHVYTVYHGMAIVLLLLQYGEDKTSIRGFFRGFRSRFSKKPKNRKNLDREKNLERIRENGPKPRTEN